MAAALGRDDLAASSSSRRSWRSQSIKEIWQGPGDVFTRNSTRRQDVDDEAELRWAAIERLPTYDRLRKGMLQQVLSNGRVVQAEVDVTNMDAQDKKQLLDSILRVVEDDNEKFLQSLRSRTDRSLLFPLPLFLSSSRIHISNSFLVDRVGIEIPKIEVKFQNLSIQGDAFVGTRALPTLLNSTINAFEVCFLLR